MPLGQDDPPNLAEIQVRNDERGKVLAELERANAEDRDKRALALMVTAMMTLTVFVPLVAALAGASVRIFRWAAGW